MPAELPELSRLRWFYNGKGRLIMKTIGVSQASKRNTDSCRAFWVTSLLLLLLLPLFLMATEAGAAKITFEPNELTATVAPGEVVTVPVAVTLDDTTAPNSYASFSLSRVDGTLDPTWINRQVYVSLNSTYNTRQVPFQVKVPAEAKGGKFKGVFRTVWLRSNEQVAPADLVINVEVLSCKEPPLFSDISSSEETINVRNNKEVAIDLSGSVSSPDECGIVNVEYQLIDEYGELSQQPIPLEINDNGTFSVAVPMVASRKGGDEDGRLYTVKFFAENDAGVVEGPETSVIVLHDNGKKRGHDSKK
jgi:hypothetical protein